MIKKHYKIILVIIVCLTIYLIYQHNNKNNINYTALGDGFALGINSFGEADYGYSDYIKDYLVKNEQLNMYTKDFCSKNMSIENLYEAVVTNKKIKIKNKEMNLKQTLRESSLVTMTIGLNDIIYNISVTENMNQYKLTKMLKEINVSFDNLITEIRKYYKKDIYVIGYYQTPDQNIYIKEGISQLNQIFKNNKNVIYIATTDIFKNTSSYLLNPDSIYPNHHGYKKIATKSLTKMIIST